MFKMLSKNRLHNKFCTKRPKVKLFYLVESKEREKREKLKRRRIYGKYVLYIIQVSVMDLKLSGPMYYTNNHKWCWNMDVGTITPTIYFQQTLSKVKRKLLFFFFNLWNPNSQKKSRLLFFLGQKKSCLEIIYKARCLRRGPWKLLEFSFYFLYSRIYYYYHEWCYHAPRV